MLKNLVTIALRIIKSERGYTVFNILGLTTGITSSLFLMIYILDELSYDDYHKNADNIYRVVVHVTEAEDEYTRPLVQAPLADELAEKSSHVKNAVRFFTSGRELYKQGDKLFYEEGFYYADSSVFEMFTYDFISGDPHTALQRAFSIVITESIARKYFGQEEPLGKSLTFIDRKEDYKVTGVIRDVPHNSHFRFDALMSINSLPFFKEPTNWGRLVVSTYLELPAGYNPADFNPDLQKIVADHVDPLFAKKGINLRYQLQRITDIHLHSKIQDEEEAGGDISFLYALSAVAAFMLIIACINYMNLTTARSVRRAREIGIRKVMGSFRRQLVFQFVIETFILTFISLVLSLILVALLMPAFNLVANKHFTLEHLLDARIFISVAGILLFVGLAGGGYPAFYLSALNPAAVLKSTSAAPGGNILIRKMLVVVQFSISIFMLVSTVVVYHQLEFLLEKDLGFNKEQIVRIAIDDSGMRRSLPVFRNMLLQDATVKYVATASATPGENVRKAIVQVEDNDGKMTERGVDWFAADYDFIPALGMRIVNGRSFNEEILSDTLLAVMVNEAMVRKMNWEEPLGKKFQAEGRQARQVIGVIEDFHQNSLYDEIEPLVVLFNRDNYYTYIKLQGDDMPGAVQRIENTWTRVYPGKPFDYQFLDQAFQAQYDGDERRSMIFSIFSLITVVIACLGLLGLTAFTTEQRAREIGIRKVVGATLANIVLLISRDFVKLVVTAVLVAFPAVYFFMDWWLDDFAYRIRMEEEVGTFIVCGLAALLVAVVTVSYHSVKAALANPVDALKTE